MLKNKNTFSHYTHTWTCFLAGVNFLTKTCCTSVLLERGTRITLQLQFELIDYPKWNSDGRKKQEVMVKMDDSDPDFF